MDIGCPICFHWVPENLNKNFKQINMRVSYPSSKIKWKEQYWWNRTIREIDTVFPDPPIFCSFIYLGFYQVQFTRETATLLLENRSKCPSASDEPATESRKPFGGKCNRCSDWSPLLCSLKEIVHATLAHSSTVPLDWWKLTPIWAAQTAVLLL